MKQLTHKKPLHGSKATLIALLFFASPAGTAFAAVPAPEAISTATAKSENGVAPFRIKFRIDMRYEEELLYNMFHRPDPAGLAARAASMNVPIALATKIHGAKDYSEVHDNIRRLIDAEYAKAGKSMDKALLERKRYWDAHLPAFSALVKEITGRSWFYPSYTYYVTAFQEGASSWYGDTIAGNYALRGGLENRILGHELLLSHAFHIMRGHVPPGELDDWKVWAFSEISAVLIMEDHRFYQFWPAQVRERNYFSASNYPQLAPLEANLRKAYLLRKDFSDFVLRAVPILKKFDNVYNAGDHMGATADGTAPYLSLAGAGIKLANETYVAHMELKSAPPVGAAGSATPIEYDLLVDTDRDIGTHGWGMPPFVQDIGVDLMVRLVLTKGKPSGETLDFRAHAIRREEIDFSMTGDVIELKFPQKLIGSEKGFDYVFAVRQYGVDGHVPLSIARLPKGTFESR